MEFIPGLLSLDFGINRKSFTRETSSDILLGQKRSVSSKLNGDASKDKDFLKLAAVAAVTMSADVTSAPRLRAEAPQRR